MIRTVSRNLWLLAGLSLGIAATNCQADTTGSFGVSATAPSINTNSLATATVFTISSLTTNGNTTGVFTGIGMNAGTPFTGGTITLGNATQFSFTNATFGTFTETVAPIELSQGVVGGVVLSESFLIVGTYTGGPIGSTAAPATFTVSFTQTGGPNNSISASATLETVPEPASIAMVGIGVLAAVARFGPRLRKAKGQVIVQLA